MFVTQAETQRQGEEIVIEINSQRTKALDSMTLQYFLAKLPYSSGTSETARVMLADTELFNGEQNQCKRTLKDLGLSDGVVVELQGASIVAVDSIEPIPMPVPPKQRDFMSVGAGACCSKYCSCFEPSLKNVVLMPREKPTMEPPKDVALEPPKELEAPNRVDQLQLTNIAWLLINVGAASIAGGVVALSFLMSTLNMPCFMQLIQKMANTFVRLVAHILKVSGSASTIRTHDHQMN